MTQELWILLRLVVSAGLGGAVGWERETIGKRAGLRTHILVALGATMFTSCDDLALDRLATDASNLPQAARVQVELLGPFQAVATGVGFLGAGTIFLAGRHQRVHGLTTAASIWCVSAVGAIVGSGRFLLASGATALILVVLRLLLPMEPREPHPSAAESGGIRENSGSTSAGT
ncbi:MAG: MgtC/SapB family protein [Planctomycetaceae bacterium]